MFRTLIVAAATGAISFGLAPTAIADFQVADPAVAGPSYGINPEPPATPVSQDSAVRKAQEYLDVLGFSRLGLIKQLVSFDEFSTADATSAVDSLDVDWNEQAARKAQEYLDVMGFSRSGLIKQLVSFDQFTPSQAAYGVTAVGL